MPRLRCLPPLVALLALAGSAAAQSPNQPRITPGPNEPDWVAILKGIYGLDMFDDLLNPLETTADATPGLFRKAGDGPISYTPILALGLVTVNRGGIYVPGAEPGQPTKRELWAYEFKHEGRDLERWENIPPPLLDGSTVSIDPGDRVFGFWLSNDGLEDGGVFTQPAEVRAINDRLAEQPYKAMIYPYVDPETGEKVPNSYLIGWEYSTNDDFQDVVCRVDNVVLIENENGK
ncbi:hypothetical protein AB1L88_23820 [Tautonia sp. JC769]|uniref:hypothetical protein n=1 Tax=Tautonia sp. JC769 TaxID=3232135 RepID=UPI003458CBDC